ncbi:MAG: dolichyl-phosphate beta-glucosyltransferase [Bacteroidota bacterium]
MRGNDPKSEQVELSIIIPAYNEALRIGRSLERILTYFEDSSIEILVVDDGSSDDTQMVANSFLNPAIRILSYGQNQGKGFAVKHGMLHAKGKYLLLTDADLSTPIEYYDHLKAFIEEYPVVIGSRGMKESDVSNSFIRVFLGKAGNKLVQAILPGIKDTQCGFKLFQAKIAQQIFSQQRLKGFGFDFEILFIAQRQKLGIREVPVKWINAEGSKVKAKHYITTLIELGTVVLNNLRGRYQ